MTAPNGTIIYQLVNGSRFEKTKIFKAFCLSGMCQSESSYINLEVILTDSFGDGWNGNILEIKQNGVVNYLGGTFTSGYSLTDAIYIAVQINLSV